MLTVLGVGSAGCDRSDRAFILLDEKVQSGIYLPASSSRPVQLAVGDLISDVVKITDKSLLSDSTFDAAHSSILIFNLDNDLQRQEALRIDNSLDTLAGRWESYVVKDIMVDNVKHLLIAGSDELGTVFGIYHFIEDYLKVSPTYYWSGIAPEKKEALSWQQVRIIQNEPTFKFRGAFINDEDLLSEWKSGGGTRNIDYRYYHQVVDPDVIRPYMETLMRLRFNLVIPASFVDIRNPAEKKLLNIAADRGLFVSMHHIEPLGVSAFSYLNYWKEKGGATVVFFLL